MFNRWQNTIYSLLNVGLWQISSNNLILLTKSCVCGVYPNFNRIRIIEFMSKLSQVKKVGMAGKRKLLKEAVKLDITRHNQNELKLNGIN